MRYLILLAVLALAPLTATSSDWDMSGVETRWNMIDKSPSIETTAEQHLITTYDGKQIILQFDAPDAIDPIIRSSGPRRKWPHTGCLMCLHNHLVGTHNQSSDYLRRNGWGVWSTIHDNLHNDLSFKGEKGRGRYIGYKIPAPKELSAFAPTPLDICEEMLGLANIGPEDIVYDLGCGDGRILIMAALKYNCRAVGLDIDPSCVEQTKQSIERYGVGHLVNVYTKDIRRASIPQATVVTLYLMPNLSAQLRSRLQGLSAGARIVAHDKPIPGWQPQKSIAVESKADNREHSIHLWRISKPKCKT